MSPKYAADDSFASRRTILKAVGGGAVATAGVTGTASADTPDTPIDVEVWFGDGASSSTWTLHFQHAVNRMANQANVNVNYNGFNNTSHSYSGQNYQDFFDEFKEEHGSDMNSGQINVLFFNSLSVGGLAHRHYYKPKNKAMAIINVQVRTWDILNQLANFPWTTNSIITAIARPLLAYYAHRDKAPGDRVNSFGTVNTRFLRKNQASPLATWHTDTSGSCTHPGQWDGTEDNIEAMCGDEDVPNACGVRTKLSSCTKKHIRKYLENVY